MRVVEDLPLVPSTWMLWKLRSGEPSAVIMRRIRARPKRMPNSSSECSWRSACASLQRAGCSLGVGMLAQVVDEHGPQRLAELPVAAVQRIGDQPFGGLDVVLGLALIAAEALGRRDHLQQRP